MWLLVFQRLVFDTLIHLVYFPIWWYTSGMKRALFFVVDLVRMGNAELAPGLWLRNIFVPMFGQSDWQGRIMSFFMRSANIVVRSIMFFIWVLIVSTMFFVWPLFPVFVVFMILQAV